MQENGRQRAAKIDRHYHASFDRFISRKRWMGMLGLMIGVAYSGWMFTSNGALQITTGELSQPHFAWNKTGCEKCHLPNVPIRKDAWGGDLIHNIAKNNQQCNGTCHTVTDHFASHTKGEFLESESCSTCHREHLGFDRSLVEVPDNDCSRCHAKLSSVALVQIGKTTDNVSNFSDNHAEFESLKQDPGTILFSHIQHMRPGQPKSNGGKDAKRLDMLPERFRKLYKDRVDADKFIQLTCRDCHSRDVELKGYEELELSESVPVAGVQSSTHMLYKPIEFEKHCVACHDLDGVPHGLDRPQTNHAINTLLPVKLLEFIKNRFNEVDLEIQTDRAIGKEMEEEIINRETRLRAIQGDGGNTCKKCHQLAQDSNSESIVMPTNLNQKWLRNAAFTHGAHLMVSCKECHAEAYKSSNDLFDSTANTNSHEEARQVMIAGIKKCRVCHIQDAEKRSQSFGNNKHVASADCVDCHRYHVDPPKASATKVTPTMVEVRRFLTHETSP